MSEKTLEERVAACEEWIKTVQSHWDKFNEDADKRDEESGAKLFRELLAAGKVNRFGEQIDNSKSHSPV